MEAFLHLDILALFWSIWANPQTKVYEILKYLLMMCDSASITWSAHIRLLFQQYSLPDPLMLLNGEPWSKERWGVHMKTAVTAYHEGSLREKAAGNSKLNFLNVQTIGLTGRPHPVLSNIVTTQEVPHSRIHIKMLAGDYPCYLYLGSDRNKEAYCRLCWSSSPQLPAPTEDMVHLLTRCKGTADTRTGILPDLLNTISLFYPENDILVHPNHTHMTQLILDPTSLNLPMSIRISPDHPALHKVLSVCRNLCFAIHKERTRKLKSLAN